ncbi:hypothetical protein NDA16_004068 [Ustilago loliicola]|nr:hypothetical protein NDA16_004068 [Ustilago loliicola]
MARKNRRNRPDGSWQNTSHHNSYHSHRAADCDNTIRCNHCDVQRPRVRFYKTVVEKDDKKLARGQDPASIKAVCRDCCNTPQSSSALTDTRPAPPPPQAVPTRGRCTCCLTEYPLTTQFFIKWDTRIDAPDRTCFPCKNNQVLDDVIVPDGYEIEFDDPADEMIMPYDSDHEDRQEALYTEFEDLDDDAKRRAEKARVEFSNLTTKLSNSLQLAQRRRRLRFRPVIEQLRDRELHDSLQRLLLENNLQESEFDRLQTTTVTRRDMDEIDVEPEFPTMVQRWRAIARTVVNDLIESSATDSNQRSASHSSDDQDNEEDRQAQEHLEFLRLPDHDRAEFLRSRRISNTVKTERQRFAEIHSGYAEQVAQSETERLSDLIDRSLAISETAWLSHRRLVPSFHVAAFGQKFLNDRAYTRASSTSIINANTGTVTAASTSAAASTSVLASASTFGSTSTPTPNGFPASAKPQPVKRPRVINRETPVDPRRALFAHRFPQAQPTAQSEGSPPAVDQQKQQRTSDIPTIKVERF